MCVASGPCYCLVLEYMKPLWHKDTAHLISDLWHYARRWLTVVCPSRFDQSGSNAMSNQLPPRPGSQESAYPGRYANQSMGQRPHDQFGQQYGGGHAYPGQKSGSDSSQADFYQGSGPQGASGYPPGKHMYPPGSQQKGFPDARRDGYGESLSVSLVSVGCYHLLCAMLLLSGQWC